MTFSLKRVGKKVNWEQSKRLRTGNLVALTPANDGRCPSLHNGTCFVADHQSNIGFKTICRIAVVAARPLAGLQQNEVDIYFGAADEVEINPQVEWIMVSTFHSRNSAFSAPFSEEKSLTLVAAS